MALDTKSTSTSAKGATPELVKEDGQKHGWSVETPVNPKAQEKLIRPYDGTSDPARWLDQIQRTGLSGKWSEEYCIQLIKSRLTGEALQYFETAVPPEEEEGLTFSKLRAILVAQFKPEEKLIVRLQRFSMCVQESEESIMTYSAKIRALGIKSCDTETEKHALDSRLMAQFVSGLRLRSTYDFVMEKNPTTFQEAVAFAKESESQTLARRMRGAVLTPVKPFKSTESRAMGLSPKPNKRAAVNVNQGRVSPQKAKQGTSKSCSYCAQKRPNVMTNHGWSECRQRLFDEKRCFTCKRKECRADTCPYKPSAEKNPSSSRPVALFSTGPKNEMGASLIAQ